jgi:drug/metabolite transporter (DMT)-like permease
MHQPAAHHTKASRKGLLLAVATAVAFGFYPAATRAVYADGGNAMLVLIIIMWSRTLGLLIACIPSRPKLFTSRAETKQAIRGGTLQAISNLALFAALVYLPGPLVIIGLFSHSLMLLFFLAWKGELKLDTVTILSTVTALLGLTFVLDVWHPQPPQYLWGVGLALFSAMVIVARFYIYGQQLRTRHPAAVGAENFLAASIALLPAMLVMPPVFPLHTSSYGWLFLAGLTTALGSIGMFYGIAMMGSFRWSLFSKVEPIFTAVFSAFFVGEVLKPSQYLGMLVVLASLAIYQTADHRRSKPAT